jgi:DHA1 family bicyclomycin/chloramphenicol resistance-like MFS transporter
VTETPRGEAYYRLAVILGALTAMGPLAIDMYLPALPTIARELHTSESAMQVSLAVYFIGIACGQAFYGPLSDRWGRKPALYFGLVLFSASSVGLALVHDVTALIALRFLQALGGCAPLVVPPAVVRDYFDQRGSVRMLSVLMLVMGLAPILAPLIGGQLLLKFGWRSVFWVLAIYGTFWLAIVTFFLAESLPVARRRRQRVVDVLGTYVGLLRDRRYIGYAITRALIFAGLMAYISGSPFVFIELFHVPPERYGLYFAVNALGIITASQINRWLASRYEARDVVGAILPVSVVAGVVMLVDAASGFGGFTGILVPLFFYIASHGFIMPNTTALAMASHGAVAGSASAMLGTVQFVLGASAGTLVGVLGNSTAVPLAAVIAGCAALALTTYQTLAR